MERQRKDDIGAQKMTERLTWGAEMAREIAKKEEMKFTEAVFIKGLEAGISMFIQSEKRK